MATREKNVWILILFILCGIVVGGLLGELASNVDFLWWLSYGEEFGISVESNQGEYTCVKVCFPVLREEV